MAPSSSTSSTTARPPAPRSSAASCGSICQRTRRRSIASGRDRGAAQGLRSPGRPFPLARNVVPLVLRRRAGRVLGDGAVLEVPADIEAVPRVVRWVQPWNVAEPALDLFPLVVKDGADELAL